MFARFAALGLLIAFPVQAQTNSAEAEESPVSSEQALLEQQAKDAVAVLKGEKPAEEVFAPAFLAQVSVEQLNAVTAQLEAQYGSLIGVESVEPSGPYQGVVKFDFEKAIGTGNIALEPTAPHKVAGFFVRSFESKDDKLSISV